MKDCETCRAPMVPNVGTNLEDPDGILLWWSCAVCDRAEEAERWPRRLLSSALGTLPGVSLRGEDGLQPPGVARATPRVVPSR